MKNIDKSKFGKIMLWGGVTTLLYWFLFHNSEIFLRLAHTTLDACAVNDSMQTLYYNSATSEACRSKSGSFIEGHWWYVLAPIVMAFSLSVTHGNFTSMFWDMLGLKAKKQ